jgi:nucleoside-diphosphate-sugar epimerase
MKHELVVVVGAAGKLGRLVCASLLAAPQVRVRALVRDPAKLSELAAAGVELVAFDAATASDAERATALAGASAVVSTLQGGPDVIIDAQLALLRAAKAAGARRFIPSDYSYDIFGLPEGVNVNSDWRRTLARLAEAEVGPSFEVVHVMQGIFADRGVLGFLGAFDAERGVVRYWGDGTTPIDWTTWADTARFTAAAALSKDALPARLYVAGDRKSILEFAAIWTRETGRAVTSERLGSLDELEAEVGRKLASEPTNMYAWLPLMYARGVYGGHALLGALANGRFPSVQAKTLVEAIRAGEV